MPLGQKSRERLNTCDPRLIEVIREASEQFELTVLCGHRGEAEQNEAFKKGNSKVQFPNSKHNRTPSLAVDVAPYPIDWNNIGRFLKMVEVIKKVAENKGIKLRFGAEFETLRDFPHIELTGG